jgi:hypothetical protein
MLANHFFNLKRSKLCDISETGPFDKNTDSYRWVVWRGITFQRGYIIWIDTDDETALPIFSSITKIIIEIDSVIFLVKTFHTLHLDEHYASYVVIPGTEYKSIPADNASLPLMSIMRNNILYIGDTGIS